MALRCTKSFAAYDGGTPRVVRVGQLVQDDDPIVRGREGAFERVEDHLERRAAVETATDEPGERREVTAPVKPKRRPRKTSSPSSGPAATSAPDEAEE
ncbi:hypothetical protein ACF06T_28805 [Streptomyces albidoflavus]